MGDDFRNLEDVLAALDITAEQQDTIAALMAEQETSEKTLRQSEAQIRAILETAVDGIVTIDHQGQILSFNPAAEKIFGYTEDEIVGRSINSLMPEPYRSSHKDYITHYLHTGQANIIGKGREVEGVRKDGTLFPLYLAVSEVQVGNRIIFTGIVRDITERKASEKALEAERNFAKAVLETVGALIIVLDTEGRIVQFNKAMERTTGYAFEEVKGRKFWDLFLLPEDVGTIRNMLQQAYDGNYPLNFKNILVTRAGDRRSIAWSNTVLQNKSGMGTYIIATGIDITDLNRAEAALVSSSEKERKLIGQELHDVLGQELTGISLLTGALERKLSRARRPETEDAAELVQLSQVLLLQVKRLAHGLYPSELEKSGLGAALAELAENQRRLHRLNCHFEGRQDISGLEPLTELHLYRIAQEAVLNAIRHGQVSEIKISCHFEKGALILAVEDDGIGLDDPSPKDAGMGLAIMKYRSAQIGATMHIGRCPNGGTRIQCVLHHENLKEQTREQVNHEPA